MEAEIACTEVDEVLDQYLDAEADGETRAALERHLARCAKCRWRLDLASGLREALRELPVEEPGAEFFAGALRRAQRPPRGSRLAAAGFIGAFGLSIVTVLLTGLAVHAPRSRAVPQVAAVTLKPNRAQTVNLVFDSGTALDDVVVTVELPRGVELRGHELARRIEWDTKLVAGSNLLPLEIVATSGRGGELVARVRHDGSAKEFLVKLSVDRS